MLLTAGLSFSYFNLLALSVYLNSVSISVLSFYCCHPSEFLMASKDNTGIFSDRIMNAIAGIKNSKKRPDNKSIAEFIPKNQSTNADFNFIEKAIEKLIKNKKVVNKPTIKGMTSYFPISDDKINENKVTESEPISSDISTSPPSNISVLETYSNCQPLFRCNDFVKNEVFNTFYEDYVEFKHYVNDIMKSVTPNSELLTSLSDENNFEKTKIKSLEEELKKLKNENATLTENILTQLKIVENLSGNNDRNTTNTSIIDKTKKKSDFNINNSNWQIAHSSKSSIKSQRGSKDIHFSTSNKFAPLLTENADDVTKCSSTNIASANSKKSHPIKLIELERKRRPDICVTENYIKNFIPVTIPVNSNYASIPKNGRKILVVGDSHIKRIRRIDFNKELRNDKAYFRSFSGATSKQLDHCIIPSLVDDKSDAVIIHVGTNDILYNASYEDIAGNIIKIGSNPALNALIRRVNDMLRDLCVINGFGFIFNDMITAKCLWKDGIHLQDLGTSVLSKNFIKLVNNYLFSNFDNRF